MPGGKLKKLIIPIVSIAILSAALITTTYTWLQSSRRADSQGTEMTIEAETYNIIVDRADTRYDSYIDVSSFKDMFDDSFDLTNSSTASSTKLGFELHNEFRYDGEYYLMPGSYGTLTFYIEPHEGVGDITVNLNLALGGYKKRYEENESTHMMDLVFDEVDDQNVLNILKGHVMFFTSRSGANFESYRYNGLITEGTFSYSTHGKSKSTDPGKENYYKVVLYWDWPVTYSEILTGISGGRYPSSVNTYINNHKNYFFASNLDKNDEDSLNDGYNDGDQLIGDNVSFLVVYLGNQQEE